MEAPPREGKHDMDWIAASWFRPTKEEERDRPNDGRAKACDDGGVAANSAAAMAVVAVANFISSAPQRCFYYCSVRCSSSSCVGVGLGWCLGPYRAESPPNLLPIPCPFHSMGILVDTSNLNHGEDIVRNN